MDELKNMQDAWQIYVAGGAIPYQWSYYETPREVISSMVTAHTTDSKTVYHVTKLSKSLN